jgi:protein-S-isoprenylcysteine O-methyltransferase Ste14
LKISQPIPERRRITSAALAAVATMIWTAIPAVMIREQGILIAPAVALALGFLALAVFGEGVVAAPYRGEILPSERWSVIPMNAIHGAVLLGSLTTALTVSAAPALPDVTLLGLVAMAAGAALRLWAVATLGSNFGDGFRLLAAKPSLNGPYRYLRHPAETGLWLLVLGFTIAVCAWSVQVVLFLLALLACSLIRLVVEERALAAR